MFTEEQLGLLCSSLTHSRSYVLTALRGPHCLSCEALKKVCAALKYCYYHVVRHSWSAAEAALRFRSFK